MLHMLSQEAGPGEKQSENQQVYCSPAEDRVDCRSCRLSESVPGIDMECQINQRDSQDPERKHKPDRGHDGHSC